MSARALLGLLALFAVLLAVVLWVDKPEKKEEDAKNLTSVLPKALADVKAIEIEGKQAPVRVERDAGNGWQLVLPFRAEADPREIETFYGSLTGVGVTRVVEEKGGDLAAFGLAKPEGRFRVFPKDASAPKELQVGRASPVGDGRYLADGSGRVLLVAGGIATALERTPDSLRERRLIPVAAEAVRQLTLEGEHGHVVLERDGKTLKLTAPFEDQADETNADSWIRAAVELRVADFAPAAATDAQTRFADKTSTITVTVEGEPARRVVELGAAGPEGKRWARRAPDDFVGLVDTASLAVLMRDPSELRDARVFAADPKDVRTVLVEGGDGSKFSARRDSAEGAWSVADAGGAARAAAPRAVEDLIDRMKWLRATSFDEANGDLRELKALTFRGEQGDLGRIDFLEPREPAAGAEKQIYVQTSWRPGLTLGVRTEAVGVLPSKPDDLVVAATPEPAKPASTP